MRLDRNRTNSTELTTTPYGLAQQLAQIYSANYPDTQETDLTYMGEVLIQSLKYSTLTTIPPGEEGIKQALEYLNYRIESVRKTISIWDAYQIKGTVQDRTTLLGQLAQLPVNSSLVSNIATPFTWVDNTNKQHTIHKGDVFLKDQNGNIYLIPSLSSGYYKPTEVQVVGENNNNISILYNYETEAPENPEVPISIEVPIEPEESGYNRMETLLAETTKTIDGIPQTGTLVMPVVKCFTEDYEQVFLNITYSVDNNTRKITLYNPTHITLLYEVK